MASAQLTPRRSLDVEGYTPISGLCYVSMEVSAASAHLTEAVADHRPASSYLPMLFG
jgi:hypothetical protein